MLYITEKICLYHIQIVIVFNSVNKNTEYGCIGSSFVKNQYHELGIKAIPITSCEKSISFGYIRRKKMRYQI